MELREYFKIIGKHWQVFWLAVIVITVGAIVFTVKQPQTFLAQTTLTVNKASAVKQSQVSYYIYDNYYNVQSSGLFSQIVTSWFSSPSVVKEIYDKAGLPLPSISQKKLAKTFRAARTDPATIDVSLTSASKEDATSLINAAASVMQSKANELGRTDKENVYDVIQFSPIVTENAPSLLLNSIIGLIVGLFIGVLLALGIEYFRKQS